MATRQKTAPRGFLRILPLRFRLPCRWLMPFRRNGSLLWRS
jgi:hypothetical protein